MAAVFADVLREQKRAKLRLASAICISLDDKSRSASIGFCRFSVSIVGVGRAGAALAGPWRDISFQASLPDGSVERGVVRAARLLFVLGSGPTNVL